MKEIVVSVCCTVYNHEDYIRDALDGFLIQETNFDYEIIVHDDASTDNSAEIILDYANKYPEIIKAIYQSENQYSQGIKPWPNFVFPKAQGKYIAICEGDDYWTDPLKLQKQVDFLEKNPDFSISFHEVKVYIEGKKKLVNDYLVRNVPKTTSIFDLLKGNYIQTPSVLYRKITIEKIPPEYLISPTGDYFLHIIAAEKGKIYKFNEQMAVYRVGNSGVWSMKSADYRIIGALKVLFLIRQYFTKKGNLNIVKLVDNDILKKRSLLLKYYFRINKSFEYVNSIFNKLNSEYNWNWSISKRDFYFQKLIWFFELISFKRVYKFIIRKING